MRTHRISPQHQLGQNFLVDRQILARIIAAASLTTEDTVLEIGPGVGTLTRELINAAGHVIAVDLDPEMCAVVSARAAGRTNIQVVNANILHSDLHALLPADQPYKVVANIPYYITAPILRFFLEQNHPPTMMVLTVQREVAERLAAKPGDMSVLAVSAQFYATVDIVATIPATSFFPPPEVGSAVIRLHLLPKPAISVDNRDRFFTVVKAGFGAKRKQIHNSLTQNLAHIPSHNIDDALISCSIDRSRRAQTLSLDEWAALYAALSVYWPGHALQS